jgi:hypothetical protein
MFETFCLADRLGIGFSEARKMPEAERIGWMAYFAAKEEIGKNK